MQTKKLLIINNTVVMITISKFDIHSNGYVNNNGAKEPTGKQLFVEDFLRDYDVDKNSTLTLAQALESEIYHVKADAYWDAIVLYHLKRKSVIASKCQVLSRWKLTRLLNKLGKEGKLP